MSVNYRKNLDELVEVSISMKKNKIRIREIFCEKNPPCKKECGCCIGGEYDDAKCPLFGKSDEDIKDELNFEYEQAVILGNLED